jgi:hypothetical protein
MHGDKPFQVERLDKGPELIVSEDSSDLGSSPERRLPARWANIMVVRVLFVHGDNHRISLEPALVRVALTPG